MRNTNLLLIVCNMKTNHTIYIHASQHMMQIEDNSIDLVVTSPPYPMIEMWDEILGEQNPNILESLEINIF